MFGESQVQHCHEKQARHWEIDGNVVTELEEYKNLGVVKNYSSSSRLDISEAIAKLEKRRECFYMAVLIRRNTNPTTVCPKRKPTPLFENNKKTN